MRMYASNQPAERPSDAATAAVALLLNRRTKLERRTVYRTIPAGTVAKLQSTRITCGRAWAVGGHVVAISLKAADTTQLEG